ncbi:MAG: M48 family metallopeptidase [Tunicatimonas sp.]
MKQIATPIHQLLGNDQSSNVLSENQPVANYRWIAIGTVYGSYLLSTALLLGLLAGGVYIGTTIIISLPFSILNILGVGLVGLSGLALYFAIRFLVFPASCAKRHAILVTAEGQPRLFKLVQQIAAAAGARVPQRVFVSPEVKVAMHYPSNFLGLFAPGPESLEIGLGLVNALTVSEFEAALGHEFSCAAPQPTALSGFAYAIHRVLYNIAHQRSQQDERLDQWATTPDLRGQLGGAARWLRNQHQRRLQQIYWLAEDQFRKVSHQAVCQADQFATHQTGSVTVVSALRKTAFGTKAYEQCSAYLHQLAERGQRSDDIYANHRTTMVQLATELALPLFSGLPVVSSDALTRRWSPSLINTQLLGQSHFSVAKREKAILSLANEERSTTQTAWKCFKNASMLQQAMTQQLYDLGFPGTKFQVISSDAFADYVKKAAKQRQMSSEYVGFYDARFLQPFEPAALAASFQPTDREITFDEIYSEANRSKIASFVANQADFEVLKHIQSGSLPVSNFEFERVRYRQKDTGKPLRLLNSELARQERWLSELDQRAFLLHFRRAQEAGVSSEYVTRYQALMNLQQAHQHFSEIKEQIAYWQNQWLHQGRRGKDEMNELAKAVATIEVGFKSHLRACADLPTIKAALPEAQQKKLIPYLSSEQVYFLNVSKFDEKAFAHFKTLVTEISNATDRAYWQSLRSVTNYQLGLQEAQEEVRRR